MSVQFGRWNFNGTPSTEDYLAKVRSVLTRWGPDDLVSYTNGGIHIFYSPFHTTPESRRECQPHVAKSGMVFTWDGRLDNPRSLIEESHNTLASGAPDVLIVATTYEQRKERAFSDLVGDWALSICNPNNRSLILAKDPIGTRHLYYALEPGQVTWCTILDPLVLFAGKQFVLDQEYLAGWLSSFPETRRTPYSGIHSVPPSGFVGLGPGRETVNKYWDFDREKRIRYRTDGEYEEHFRLVFREAVRRRLRSHTPVLAELSGGLDSSSIVCMADRLSVCGCAETPRLDTISYYDDREPNWNERPYFTKVEQRRGRVGCHIDIGAEDVLEGGSVCQSFAATPGSMGRRRNVAQKHAAWMIAQGNRVVLSGTGGDEVMGGVPTPLPAIQDLLVTGQLGKLATDVRAWAIQKRKPWFLLLFEAARGFLPPTLVGISKDLEPAPWLLPSFVRHHRAALAGYPSRRKVFGPLPSFQENLATLEALRRQLACTALPSAPVYEKRYPFLDRDLLEFIYAIPREQVVRPGERRSLMRRALRGTVPDEILARRRKAFLARSPLTQIASEFGECQDLLSASAGIVNGKVLRETVEKGRRGCEVPLVILMRTLAIELWLRNVEGQGIVAGEI